jgi:hypothetical protein
MYVFMWVVGGHSYACPLNGKKFGGNNGRCRLSCLNNLCKYECLTVMLIDLKVGIWPTSEMWNIFQASWVWLLYNECVISKTLRESSNKVVIK